MKINDSKTAGCGLSCFIGEQPHPGEMEITQISLQLAEISARDCVLDLGCGSGKTVQFLTDYGCAAYGLDYRMTENTFLQNFAQADWLFIPFKSNHFDAVMAECTFSLVNVLNPILAEIYRVLKPGGKLVFNGLYTRNPEVKPYLKTIDENCSIYHVQGETQLRDVVEGQGFCLAAWEDHSAMLRTKPYQEQIMLWNRGLFKKQTVVERPQNIDAFDLFLDIAKLKLGYYAAVAEKK